MTPPALEPGIRACALALGFDAVAFTTPTLDASVKSNLRGYLDQQHHGDMGWMEDKADRRADPLALWPEAKSVIVVGHNYAPEASPMEKLSRKTEGNISVYAQGDDYHDVIKKRLKEMARWLVETYGCEVKVFVDTAPVMEKALAAQAGMGWQGKHTCLVSREFGSWLFLGCIFTSIPVETLMTSKSASNVDLCGTCTKCLDICPTQAFTAERQLDARRCIAYLTNEHKGQIPLEFRKAMGNRIYGCDDCLAICPWNKFAEASKESAYHARDALQSPQLRDLVTLDDASFRALFRKSPVKRIGRDRFVRNVLVAAGNSEDVSLMEIIAPLVNDPSPLVSEMAAWAIEELKLRAI